MSARARAASLALAAMLASLAPTASAQLWSRPVTCDDCISDYYYVDQGFSQDWDCGNSTYSDHTGTDYSLRNGNFAIDQDNEVVAMAPGIVVSTQDGYYDRCTQCGGFNCGTGIGNGFANQVIINHGAHRVIYGHMKEGSVAVQQGDMVTCGQVIGFIGSSGCSTGAHLHIEPSLAAEFGVGPYRYIDPYAGECSTTTTSLWSDQGGYRVLPGSACEGQPAVPACPSDSYPIWTCMADGSGRRRCVDGVVADEACPAGCNVMPPGTDDVCELPPDGDGDGSRSDVDCDDADATRHPGVVELCGDAVDQDCSGADLACPVPEPSAGSGGIGGAAGAAAGGASGQAGAFGAPGVLEPGGSGTGGLPIGAGQVAPAPVAGGNAPLPLPQGPANRVREQAGCSVGQVAPSRPWAAGRMGVAIAGLALLGLRPRRRRGKPAHLRALGVQDQARPFQNRVK
jgi:hypothetical protein